MSDCATSAYHFATPADLPLQATFDGGRLTSDGGLPWLGQAEAHLGLCTAFANCLNDWRKDPARSRHSLEQLLRQRLFQLACGYSDQNDADSLRRDPLFKMLCGQAPASGHDLASQPTLSRLENSADRHSCRRLAYALARLYLAQRGKGGRPERILLDFDSTTRHGCP